MLENSHKADVSCVDMSYEVARMHFEEDKYTRHMLSLDAVCVTSLDACSETHVSY